MNFEERMELLRERHEALAQSVELTAHTVHELSSKMEQNDATIKQILQAIAQDAENIRALARIAEAHEHRIDRIEGNPQ